MRMQYVFNTHTYCLRLRVKTLYFVLEVDGNRNAAICIKSFNLLDFAKLSLSEIFEIEFEIPDVRKVGRVGPG